MVSIIVVVLFFFRMLTHFRSCLASKESAPWLCCVEREQQTCRICKVLWFCVVFMHIYIKTGAINKFMYLYGESKIENTSLLNKHGVMDLGQT